MIKAIETRYAGCHFRSRLEARWAVAFDHLGIAWEYEPEGFETSAGRYLPDFRLNTGNPGLSGVTWFEVKPPDYAEYDPRHQTFANESGERLIVAAGMCRDYRSQYLGFPLVEHGWSRERGYSRPISLYVTNGGALLLYSTDGPSECLKVDTAYAAARSARFDRRSSRAGSRPW